MAHSNLLSSKDIQFYETPQEPLALNTLMTFL